MVGSAAKQPDGPSSPVSHLFSSPQSQHAPWLTAFMQFAHACGRTPTAAGQEGRFLAEQHGSYQRMGPPNPLGSKKFDIPTVRVLTASWPCPWMPPSQLSSSCACMQVPPRLSYVLLFLNLALYGGGIAIALTQGNDASNEWFLSLAKMNDKVAGGEFYR